MNVNVIRHCKVYSNQFKVHLLNKQELNVIIM